MTAPSIRAGTPPIVGGGDTALPGGPVPLRRVPPGDPDPPPAGVPGQSKAGGAGTDPGQYPPAAGLYTAGPAPGGGQAHRSEGPPGLHRTDPGAPPGRGVRRRGAGPRHRPFRAQLELDDEGYFRSGEDCRTRLPGVFVAGDCRAKEVRQLATAVGDGAVAGLAAAGS